MSEEMAPTTFAYLDPSTFQATMEESLTRPSTRREGYHPKQGAVGQPERNVFRIMPPHPNMTREIEREVNGVPTVVTIRDWCMITKTHFSLGPKHDTSAPCLEPYSERCPACDEVEHLWVKVRAGHKDLKDQAYQMKANWRFTLHVVDMLNPNLGVQRYHCGVDVEKRLRTCFQDDYRQPRDITHPKTGRDIIMDVSTKPNTARQGFQGFAQYDLIKAADQESAIDMKWLTQIEDLSLLRYQPTEDEVRGALQGKRIDRTGGVANLVPASPLPAARLVGGGPYVVQGPVATPPGPVAAAPAPAPVPAAPVSPPPSIGTNAAPPPRAGRKAPARGPAVPEGPPPVAPVSGPVTGPVMMPITTGPVAPRWQAARTEIQRIGLQAGAQIAPLEPTEVNLNAEPKVPCWRLHADPLHTTCQGCPLLLPCFTIRYGLPE